MNNRNKYKLNAADYHELFMVILSGFMLASNTNDLLQAWTTIGLDGISIRTWLWFALACFVFWFFTRQHIKMRKHRKEKQEGLASDAKSEAL